MTSSKIKSITLVRAMGAGCNGSWAVRARLTEGEPVYSGIGAGYTLAQAQALAQNCGEAVGSPVVHKEDWLVLPDGVTVHVT